MKAWRRDARGRGARYGFAAALTAATVAALAAVGGISYAATATRHTVAAVKRVVAPKATKAPRAVQLLTLSAGGDQYRPGYGWGDTKHIHTGPPGLQRGVYDAADSGSFAPPPSNQPLLAGLTGDRRAFFVKTEIALDEQSDLFISVVDGSGNRVLLTQKGPRGGSFVGGPLTGAANVKTIKYRVLVPRSVPIVLRLPTSVVKRGSSYTLLVTAISPTGQRSQIKVPFTVPAA
jgi:hypothetical protein